MDFFEQQDRARVHTRRLMWLFALAVVCIIFLVNLLLVGVLFKIDTSSYDSGGSQGLIHDFIYFLSQFPPEVWLISTLGILIVTGSASLYKHAQISRGGGSLIAEQLDGRLLTPGSGDFYERRLLNIVEEMAIASGMPVPPIYVLDEEEGINAFAAGHQPSDAVIGVTRGCMTTLNREQLQGVIGHEFSHIFNGDMRLNMRLISVLHGILFISLVGYWIIRLMSSGRRSRSSKKNDGTAVVLAIGVGLIVIGSIGVFFGRLIKASASRQREYLADASAAQFTRNPKGISDALKVIGGSVGTQIEHPRRDEASHMFFGSVKSSLSSAFATHPQLEDRIRRLDPQWDGQFLKSSPQDQRELDSLSMALNRGASSSGMIGDASLDEADAPKDQAHSKEKLMMSAVLAASSSLETAPAAQASASSPLQAFSNQASSGSTLMYGSPATVNQDVARLNTLYQEPLERLIYEARDPYSARCVVLSSLLSEDPAVRSIQLQAIEQSQGVEFKGLMQRLEQLLREISPLEHLPLIEKAIPALKQMSLSQYQAFSRDLETLIKADQRLDLYEWCVASLVTLYLKPQFRVVPSVKPRIKNLSDLRSELEVILTMVAAHGHDNEEEARHAFTLAASTDSLASLGLNYRETAFNWGELDQALVRLRSAYPLLKKKTCEALEVCVKADGVIVDAEAQLLYTIAALLETPISALSA